MGVTAGIVVSADFENTSRVGPPLVKLKKAGLRPRINCRLTLHNEAGRLTSFANLELVGRFLLRMDFRPTLWRAERDLPQSDYAALRS